MLKFTTATEEEETEPCTAANCCCNSKGESASCTAPEEEETEPCTAAKGRQAAALREGGCSVPVQRPALVSIQFASCPPAVLMLALDVASFVRFPSRHALE